MTPAVSVLCPVFCAEPNDLSEIQRRCSSVFDALSLDAELIFIDDASPDGRTWPAIRELTRSGGMDTIGIRLVSNVQQSRALAAGFSISRGEAIITIDSDLDDPPEYISELLAEHRAGHDLVVALRPRHSTSRRRRLASAVLNRLLRAKGSNVPDAGSSFMLLERSTAAAAVEIIGRTRLQMVLPMLWDVARSPTSVAMTGSERSAASHYSTGQLVRIAAGALRAPAVSRQRADGARDQQSPVFEIAEVHRG